MYIFILVCSIISISVALFSLLPTDPSESNRFLDVLGTVQLLLLLNFCVPLKGTTVAQLWLSK